MITIKKPEEIKTLGEGGKILARILRELAKEAVAGISTWEIDKLAEKKIREAGGEPSFRGFGEPPYPATICASLNNELVHTIPAKEKILKAGDIFSIDIGMRYPAKTGLYTDHAITIPIGKVSREAEKLIKTTKTALAKGIAAIKPGGYIHDIGKAVQKYVEAQGFSVVRALVGHGVGYEVHEDPRIPNFYNPEMPKIEIKQGMVLAIEPMVSQASYKIKTCSDGWTIVTADGKLCAHFEHTIVVASKGAEILTK